LANFTHLFSRLDAFPADINPSKAVEKVGWGAAVYLTAAAMPGAYVRFECIEHKKHHTSTNKTHLFVILLAFPEA
jgi:hypothetical protein